MGAHVAVDMDNFLLILLDGSSVKGVEQIKEKDAEVPDEYDNVIQHNHYPFTFLFHSSH